jgi:hypothetical protein
MLADLPELELSETVRTLSPFESDGLGTYDDLRLIKEIDNLYLFFEQLTYLRGSPDLNQ